MRRIFAVLAALALWTGIGTAGTSLQVPIGARAIGMGGAFSAVSDDASSIFWNPAGLPWVGHQEVILSHANLYGLGINDDIAGFVLPLSPSTAVGIDWYHSGFDDGELDFGENRIDLAVGRRIFPFLSAGITAKYLNRSTALDGSTIRRGKGASFDLGLIGEPLPGLRVAAVAQDPFDSKIAYAEGAGTQIAYRRTTKLGAAYTYKRALTAALDWDDRIHAGLEYRPLPPLALRAGIVDDLGGPDGMAKSFGVGLRWSVLRFDYALVTHPTLGETSHYGLGVAFNFNPSLIRLEKVEPHDLYASLYKSYAREPFGVLRARNLDDKPIEATIRVFAPGLMDRPSEQSVVLRPGAAQEIGLTAVMADRVMARAGDRPAQVEVTATYQSLRLARTERASGRCIAYGPGAVDWSRGADQIAAFVTSRDPAVDEVARGATRTVALMGRERIGIRNVAFCMAIVDALRSMGIAYVPDPINPYATISGAPHAVDTVAYPRESLTKRTGDCDDTSALLAALLQNVGIRTKVVDVPGHLFLLADTGVHERNQLALGLPEDQYVIVDNEAWLPIETTAIGSGFSEAWRIGAESYASWSARGRVALVDVEDAQSRYEPTEPPSGGPMPQLDRAALEALLGEDLRVMSERREAYLASRFDATRAGLTVEPDALNEVAHAQFLAGRWNDAAQNLERALAQVPRSPRYRNNLGVVRAASGALDEAVSAFTSSLATDPSVAGSWLNLGLTRYVAGDSTGADDALSEGIRTSGGYIEACRILGIDPGEDLAREGTRKVTTEEARQLLKNALRRVPEGKSTTPPRTESKPSTGKPKRVWTSRVAAGRGEEAAALSDLLYWSP